MERKVSAVRRLKIGFLVVLGAVMFVLVDVGIAAITSPQQTTASSVAVTTSGVATIGSSPVTTTTAAASASPTSAATTTQPNHEIAGTPSAEPTSTPPSGLLPQTAFGSLTGERDQVFSGLTIKRLPSNWFTTSASGSSHVYLDGSTCNGVNRSDCASVTFLNLRSGSNRVNYMPDPIRTWARNTCPSRVDAVQGPAAFNAGGQPAKYYKLACKGIDYYAWLVPGKDVLVLGVNGKYNDLEVPIVQAVMTEVLWN
ncbi:MAG TPA: hypothetical protein VIQ80_03450 [Candidatus Saccharimonadales bacterium]